MLPSRRMYQPRLFREENRGRLHDLIDTCSFGTLVVCARDGETEISHLPFVLDRDVGAHGRLRVHTARANPICKLALGAARVTAVFSGPHGYVSPAWYERPDEQVPTWNYAVVHAHGAANELERQPLVQLLDDLVSRNEGDGPGAWRTSMLRPGLRDRLLDEIVGLSIDITALEGKFKLSQNRSAPDQARVVEALCGRAGPDDLALARLMSRD